MSATAYGVPVYPQIAIGKVLKLDTGALKPATHTIGEDWIDTEFRAWNIALKAAKAQLDHLIQRQHSEEVAAILRAQMMILEDPFLEKEVKQNISGKRQNVQLALHTAVETLVALFEELDGTYLRERAGDLADLYGRLMGILKGQKPFGLEELRQPVIVVARGLTPSQAAGLNTGMVRGFVTALGMPTGHAELVARHVGLPAVTACGGVFEDVQDGDTLIVDGQGGVVIVRPSQKQVEEYFAKQQELEEHKERLALLREKTARTNDGHKVVLSANASSLFDVRTIAAENVDGVGVLRTEFLFQYGTQPSEERQFEVYKEAVELMGDRPVTICTVDLCTERGGAEKESRTERNPVLGMRAVRLCLERKEMFKTQLRAILRASAYGKVRLLYPFIISLEEMVNCGSLLNECMQELDARGERYDKYMETGILIETPSAVILAEELAHAADFFCIYTNELAQYLLAVDRGNTRVAPLYSCYHPTVLRSINYVIRCAHKMGKWVGMCGNFSGDIAAVPILLGMGLDEFSVNIPALSMCKDMIRKCSMNHCNTLAQKVLGMRSRTEVETHLAGNMN